jgi:hypothetical protein
MIPPELAAFLQEGLGMHVGTRNAALEPNGVRALAIRVDPDGDHLTVFVPSIAAARVLPDLQSNQQITVSFGRPIDERACQVKGVFVDARDAREEEREIVSAQWIGYKRSLEQIGIPRAAMREWVTWPAVALRFRATAVFEQTPGPGAGKPLQ